MAVCRFREASLVGQAIFPRPAGTGRGVESLPAYIHLRTTLIRNVSFDNVQPEPATFPTGREFLELLADNTDEVRGEKFVEIAPMVLRNNESFAPDGHEFLELFAECGNIDRVRGEKFVKIAPVVWVITFALVSDSLEFFQLFRTCIVLLKELISRERINEVPEK